MRLLLVSTTFVCNVYVGSVLLYCGCFVLVGLILLLIFVVRASDCLEDRLQNDL